MKWFRMILARVRHNLKVNSEIARFNRDFYK